MTIREYLSKYKLLTDGAMGTYFDKTVHSEYSCSEAANIADPESVKDIHTQYLQSGSRLIRTNTFSCNRATLSMLANESSALFSDLTLREFVQAGYDLAKNVVDSYGKSDVYLAADIGPIPEEAGREREDVLLEYREICDAFLERGANIFVLETFPDEKDVLKIAEYIKNRKADAFILAQFSFSNTGFGSSGYHYRTVLANASASGLLDAVGMNCSLGASHMKKFLRSLKEQDIIPQDKYISVLPNSGYPKIVRGRAVYSEDAAYFGDKVKDLSQMGASILGGCCGTSPDSIQQINQWLQGQEAEAGYFPQLPEIVIQENVSQSKAELKNTFRDKLKEGKTVFAVELDPPFDCNVQKLLEGAELLKGSRADIVTIADSPLARARADSIMMASFIKDRTGLQVMPHVACRDRNRISMRGSLLGAHIREIRNLLIVTGDPVGAADKTNTRSVFDYNSIKFMQAMTTMNQELFAADPFFYGGALNQNGANPEAIAKRMRAKMEQGCSYFLSQPVYSGEEIQRLQWLKEQTGAKILVGIMPLVSRKNALFIKNEMPGIEVPDSILDQYKEDAGREAWEEAAIAISLDIMKQSKHVGAGYYFVTPFNRVSLIKRILDKVTLDEDGRII